MIKKAFAGSSAEVSDTSKSEVRSRLSLPTYLSIYTTHYTIQSEQKRLVDAPISGSLEQTAESGAEHKEHKAGFEDAVESEDSDQTRTAREQSERKADVEVSTILERLRDIRKSMAQGINRINALRRLASLGASLFKATKENRVSFIRIKRPITRQQIYEIIKNH